MTKRSEIPKFGLCSGIKVVHCATAIAGPTTAYMFAENGADVIWIENPYVISMTRSRFGNAAEQDARNERTLNLDITSPEGKEILIKLLEDADVLIESSKAKQWDKYGLDDETLWKINPRLVILHISGYGQDGDPNYINRPGFDTIGQAFGCYMAVNGYPDGDPLPVMPFPIDYMSGLVGFGYCMAGFAKARETGVGESIDLAHFEMAVRHQVQYSIDYMSHGNLPPREGDHSKTTAGYGMYKCKDGKSVYIMVLGNGPLSKALPLLGIEWGSELFPSNVTMIPMNSPAAEVLEKALTKFVSEHTAAEVEEIFVANGVPASKVMDLADAEFHPHYLARDVFTSWYSSHQQRMVKGVNIVPRVKNHPQQIWRGCPNPGEDNEDILFEVGLSEEQIQGLYDKGVLVKTGPLSMPPGFEKTRDWQAVEKEKLGK